MNYVYVITALISSCITLSAQSSAEILDLIKKGERRLEFSEDNYSTYKCRLTSTSPPENATDKPNVRVLNSTVQRQSGRVLVKIDMPPSNTKGGMSKSGTESILCINDNAFFGITSIKNSGIWSLVQFARTNHTDEFRKSIGQELIMAYPLRSFTTALTISDILNDPSLFLKSVRTRPDGLIDTEYSVHVTKPKDATLEGTLTVSPAQDYVVVENTHQFVNFKGYRNKMTRILGSHNASYRSDVVTIEAIATKSGVASHIMKFDFSEYATTTLSKDIFNLEHYGIPTPDDDLVPWYSRWKVWALLAICGMVLAVLFRRLAVRRRVR